jgi:glutaredoxin
MAVRPRLLLLLRGPFHAALRRPLVGVGVPLLSAILFGAAGVRAEPAPQAGHSTTPTLGQAIKPSNANQLALSEHLRRVGAVFYGAWWCPACFKQKNLFGQEAGNQLPYVECEKKPEQRERCQALGIQAYPTWVLGNERREGVLTLEELKSWSGYNR